MATPVRPIRRNGAVIEVRIPADLRDQARARASSLGLSLSSLVRVALVTLLDGSGPGRLAP
jgi:antitoxin component of RelBE/YafQ-DinJ toxin-antitoxin module